MGIIAIGARQGDPFVYNGSPQKFTCATAVTVGLTYSPDLGGGGTIGTVTALSTYARKDQLVCVALDSFAANGVGRFVFQGVVPAIVDPAITAGSVTSGSLGLYAIGGSLTVGVFSGAGSLTCVARPLAAGSATVPASVLFDGINGVGCRLNNG